MAERIDVFISSTSRDLVAYRDAIAKVILRLGMYPIDMATFNPTDRNALQLCYDKVNEAEIFIGIYAYRYGYVPGSDVSYITSKGNTLTGDSETGVTHLEYLWAVERNLPMLLFVISDTNADGEPMAWPVAHIEDEPGKSRLKSFKNLIMSKHVVGFFHSPDHLATQVATGLAELKTKFNSTEEKPVFTSTRHDFYKHIQLPPNYVPRTDILAKLRLTLLGDGNIALTSALKSATALHGMGGIGKSVMARALCDDPVVQAAYTDGILWTTLGQEPNLVAKLREWIEVLGGTVSENAPTADSLKAKLASLLEHRNCLLIVDDVWQKKHAESFRVGGENCRLLLTTRDSETARSLGATIQPIPTMSALEAIDLLKEWAFGALKDADPIILTKIVNKLGRLPLAIKLAGAQLHKKNPEKWLESFDARKLASRRPEDIHDSLEQTLGLSLDLLKVTERKLYAALAIFKEDEPIREIAIQRLWGELGNLDEDETQELIDDLSARAVLEVVDDVYPRAVLLHDLLRDFMVAELDNPQTIHKKLLDAYQKTKQSNGWDTAPDDGYLHAHLVYHLQQLEDFVTIRALFSNQNWMHVRVASDAWRYDGYLADLSVYEMDIFRRINQATNDGNPNVEFAEYFRYALIVSSINSILANYPPRLVFYAIKEGLWSIDRALSVADKIPERDDISRKIQIYLAILNTQQPDNQAKQKIYNILLDALRNSADDETTVQMLKKVVPYLPDEYLKDVLEIGRSIKKLSKRIESTYAFLDRLPIDHSSGLITATAEVLIANVDEEQQYSNLRRHIERIPENTRALLLDYIKHVTYPYFRADLLVKLLPSLPIEDKEEFIKEILSISADITEMSKQSEVYIDLFSHLSESQKTEVIHRINKFSERETKLKTLIQILPNLSEDYRNIALNELLDISKESFDGQESSNIMFAILPYVNKSLQDELVVGMVENARNMPKGEYPLTDIIRLLPFMSEVQLEHSMSEIIEHISNMKKPLHLSSVIRIIPNNLDQKIKSKIQIAAIKQVQQNIGHAMVMVGFFELIDSALPSMEFSVQEELIQLAYLLKSNRDQLNAFICLLPYIPPSRRYNILKDILVRSQNLKENTSIARALVHSAPHLASHQLSRIAQDAIEAAKYMMNVDFSAWYMIIPELFDHLSDDLLKKIYLDGKDVLENREWVYLLTLMLPFQSQENQNRLILEGISVIKDITRPKDISRAISLLAPYLGNHVVDVVEIARKIPEPEKRIEAIAALIPYSPEYLQTPLLQEVLASLKNISDEIQLKHLLIGLARHDLKNYASHLLPTALQISNKENKLATVIGLLPYLSDEFRSQAVTAILDDIELLEPIKFLDDSVDEFLPYLPPIAISNLFEVVNNMSNDKHRADALIQMIPYLSEELLYKIWESHKNVVDKEWKVKLRLAVVPYLSNAFIDEVFDSISNGNNEQELCDFLIKTLPNLEDDLVIKASSLVSKISAPSDRIDIHLSIASRMTNNESLAILDKVFDDLKLLKRDYDYLHAIEKIQQQWSNHHSITKKIHFALLEYLKDAPLYSQNKILSLYSVLNPPTFPAAVLAQMAENISEICMHWEWL